MQISMTTEDIQEHYPNNFLEIYKALNDAIKELNGVLYDWDLDKTGTIEAELNELLKPVFNGLTDKDKALLGFTE
jgi:hypothetical protein